MRGRKRAAAGVDAVVGHDDPVADPLHVREQAGVQVLRHPMHHRLLAGQHPARGQQGGAHAQAGDFAAFAVVAGQPVDECRCPAGRPAPGRPAP
ncbi:hypothetical protein G6F40_017952 [Rhizopus arrhizus]|nr:hypothetical protein G6F40_017952 [Rhizopus arrhizus]